jgi:hypothetical protein
MSINPLITTDLKLRLLVVSPVLDTNLAFQYAVYQLPQNFGDTAIPTRSRS